MNKKDEAQLSFSGAIEGGTGKTVGSVDTVEHGHYRDNIHHAHRPYWKRAHRDWRVWVALFFLFAAMFVYVMSDDLALIPRSHQSQPQSNSVNK